MDADTAARAAEALSLARTALTDPAGLPIGLGLPPEMDIDDEPAPVSGARVDYAVERIDEAINLLVPEDGLDT